MFFRQMSVLLCAALMLVCTACAPDQPAQSVSAPDEPAVSTIVVTDVSLPAPPAASSSEDPAPLPEPEPVIPYDFSVPVAESDAVDHDYFSDAAFVGDSRMEGFYLYSGVKRGKKIATSGMSVFNIDEKNVFKVNGAYCTALDMLEARQYGKVYLGLGATELGYINTEKVYDTYCRTVDAIRTRQPNAVIYLLNIIPVNEGQVAASGGAGHLNNDRVRFYNELIAKVAAEKQVALLDQYSAFAVDGALPKQGTRDGVHLTRDYYEKQLEYLKTHTVSFDTLYPSTQSDPEVLTNETPVAPADDLTADSDSLHTQAE